jgi:hypothetical protein
MTQLFTVTCVIRGSSQLLQFQHSAKATADRTYELLDKLACGTVPGNMVEIRDDFGCQAMIAKGDLGVFFLQDLKRQMDASGEIELMKAQANAVLQRRAQSDPIINFNTNIQPPPQPVGHRTRLG